MYEMHLKKFAGQHSKRYRSKIITCLLLLTSFGGCVAGLSSDNINMSGKAVPPPIVWSIAGSDSGGGAGIQADLHAMHNMQCHGCSVITCLTAQNSCGVSGACATPSDIIEAQMEALWTDLPPRAIKIGALLETRVVETVGKRLVQYLDQIESSSEKQKPWIVLDPVMISTSGHKLLDDDAIHAMKTFLFPHIDVLTPNKFEAEALLDTKLTTPASVEQGARDILQKFGVKAVLIKGGHSLKEDEQSQEAYAQDYFLSSSPLDDGPLSQSSSHDDKEGEKEYRLCDGTRGVWIRNKRFDTINTHGTGCTLSSAMASALAIAHYHSSDSCQNVVGAKKSILPVDAICLAKAYVTAGIAEAVQLGDGPGPVVHTEFPDKYVYFPTVTMNPESKKTPAFVSMNGKSKQPMGTILPIVDNVEWTKRLCEILIENKDNENDGNKELMMVQDIQLRIKGITDTNTIVAMVAEAQSHCAKAGIRLWINDHWEAAIAAKCFGVHVGQEDLAKCYDCGGLDQIQQNGLALGVSTHSYAELSVALGIRPSYISLGPVFGTSSKNVAFSPQGLETVQKWRNLINPDIPLIAIGGISDDKIAKEVKNAGADCIAVIGAITQSDDVPLAIKQLYDALK